MRVVRTTGNVFIVVGATLLFFVLYSIVGTSLVTNGHQQALAAEFSEILLRPTAVPSAAPSPQPKPSRKARPGPDPIARIRIPKIWGKASKIVVEGTTLGQLAWGPGHYVGTPGIGEQGTTGVAGHRTGWGSPFINLDKLRKGDEVIFETAEATYVYAVTRRAIVDPGDVWVLGGDRRSDATHKLALTTCTPKYTSRDRMIVWGDLVKTIPR